MHQRNDGNSETLNDDASRGDEEQLETHSGSENPSDKMQEQGQDVRTRALIICPVLKFPTADSAYIFDRSNEARLAEARGLAAAIDLNIIDLFLVTIAKPRPGTLLGVGKLDEIASQINGSDIDLVIIDSKLSPIQQRNLERRWKIKILDRTGLILEIFGERAETAEGRLQVELAHLNYQKSRLVRSWTHLERQRGGFGFLGGPGETQIESDKRQISGRIAKIKRQLNKVQKTRALHRSSRKKVPYPVVALVGYTNAGKSTLFNYMTEANVVAKDQLFATLDPTMRGMTLPSGHRVILSDTVGFVSDLPHELVAAFRATLEEVLEADVILHVRDIAHEDSDIQAKDVASVLGTLGIDIDARDNSIEAWNKADLLESERREELVNLAERQDNVVVVSAVTGEGVSELCALIEQHISADDSVFDLTLRGEEGKALNWLYENCDILVREDDPKDGTLDLKLRVSNVVANKLQQKFGERLIKA